MKKNISLLKTTLTLISLTLSCLVGHAYEFDSDGVRYSPNIDNSTVTALHTTYSDYKDLLVVPANVTYNGKSYKVIKVGNSSSYWQAHNIVLSEGIEEIGEEAFELTYQIKTIDLPRSINKIGEYAFHGEYVDHECDDNYLPQEIFFRGINGLMNCEGQSALDLFGVLCFNTKIYIPKGEKQVLPLSIVNEIKYLYEIDYDTYVPLVREGVQWVHFWSRPWTLESNDRIATPTVYEFSGTKVIDGVEYAKLYSFIEGGSIDYTKSPVAYVREQDKVVYRRWDKSYPEEIVYDFNNMANAVPEEMRGEWLDNGDYSYTVENIVIDGQLHKKHIFNEYEIIEGVGAINNHASIIDGLYPELIPDGSTDGLSHVIEHGDVIAEGSRRAVFLAWGSGDADGNGVVNGSDVTALYNHLLSTPEDFTITTIVEKDLNRDGHINGSDITALYNLLLK